MSRTLLPLAGFEVTLNGRFWVTAEAREIDYVIVDVLNDAVVPFFGSILDFVS